MKRSLHLIGIISAYMLLLSIRVVAQESCSEKLYNANLLYEKGQLNEAIAIAQTCVAESNSTSEKWQAYRLMAIANLGLDQAKEARKATEKMMEINPTYQPSELKDPPELIRLIKSTRVIPKFTLGMAATIGGNRTIPIVIDTYNGSDYEKKYSNKNSWQVGLMMGYNLNEIISFQTGLMASSKAYSIGYSVGENDININENLVYLDIPFFARFTSKPVKNFRFFADAGLYAGRLLSSTSDFSRTSKTTGISFSNNNLDSKTRRNNYEYGFLYGVGTMYKINQINIALDLKYYLSYANITNPDNRYEYENLFYGYYFIEDNLRLNNLSVSLSLFYNLNYKVSHTK